MIPTSQQGGDGDLEDRLRGLILNNAREKAPGVAMQPPISPRIPPHMSAAPLVEQQQYLARTISRPPTSSSFPSTMVGSRPATHGSSGPRPQGGLDDPSCQNSQPGRKRLNQAQRRQMNSQLSVPFDGGQDTGSQPSQGHTPNHGTTLQAFASSQSNSSSQPGYNQRYPQQQQQYSPHLANQKPSQYSRRPPYSQAYRQSPTNYNQSGHLSYGTQDVQATNQAQKYQGLNQQGPIPPFTRPPPESRQLYQPSQYGGQGRGRQFVPNPEEIANQSSYLATLLQDCVLTLGIDAKEEAEKETFRAVVENACREAILQFEKVELGNPAFDASSVELKCFGSMSSGFATKASDMDLALLTPSSNPPADSPESPIPRLLEKTLLNLGYGARLLTRTRVPIIKLCQEPTPKLLSGLLEARMKWENGFVTDPEEEDEETVGADFNPSIKDTQLRNKDDKSVGSPELSITDVPSRDSSSAENYLAKLKQKSNQSLSEYFNMTKRQLRKVGGRDISAGSPPLSIAECNLLNDVCRAFISGLSSEILATRLRSCHNISPLFDSSLPPFQRSLNGLWSQIEGERLAIAFENRPLAEASEKQEQECLRVVEEWRSLQNQITSLVEPLVYNRQLHMAAERLKAFNSLQLVLLRQIQHEDPIYYQKRAQKIYDDLKARDQHTADSITPIVISHYVAGIANAQIQNEMQDLSYSNYNIKDVALKHRTLQLAIDYEHALNHNLYKELDRIIVQKYIAFLRDQSQQKPAEPTLVARIRTLPDPTVMSPNKPRDRYKDELEFPKTNIGIQCDINFAAHLALHNTLLLRCYSHSDSRVKPLVLFIKHWAKVRGINTPYRGSLSSYGYVLMVLHYLVNVAQPFVCPNLQLLHKEPSSHLSPAEIESRTTCMGRDVRFWRNEAEIKSLATRGMLNHNHDSVGTLLRGFFEYFAQGGQMTTVHGKGFDWGREVLSLRNQGGIMSKAEKGWVGAKTTVETATVAAPPTPLNHVQHKESGDMGHGVTQNSDSEVKITKPQVKTVEETKEIRHRYLFAIEDPFELDHNVARTVTHNGIVSIRDEFRRAWRLIKNIGRPGQSEGLLDPANTGSVSQPGLHELLDLIHGNERAATKIST